MTVTRSDDDWRVREVAMRRSTQTAGIAASVLLCLVAVGTAAAVVMIAGPYALMYLLNPQEDWQVSAAVTVTWSVALVPIIAVVCGTARSVARRGDSISGIMLGVAAYPVLCLAAATLTPESLVWVRSAGVMHGYVAVPVAVGVAIAWALIRPRRSPVPMVARRDEAVAPRWRPVA